MKLKFALVAAILLLAVSLFAYEDGFLLGGNNCGTKYFNEDISRSFNKVFDVAITFNSINNANALISDRVGLVLDSNRAYAYDLKSGKEMWKYPADKELDENITSKPFSYDGKIYFTTLKVLYCLDEISGKILWRKNITETMGPVFRVSKGVMFMTSDDGKIYRISPESGEDVASPLSFKKTSPKNSLLIKDNYVVVTTDNSLTCYDLKKDKEIYTVQIPATASSYSPLISNDYIIVPSEESVVIYSIDKGKEKGRRKMPNSVSATPVTDGKYIYVACSDSKIYTLGFDKKLTMAGEGLATANIVDNFIALSDEAFIVSDSKGLITAYSLADQSVVWQFQPGMYSQGGVTAQIPGIGTADITAQTEFSFNVGSGNGGGQGMGRGGQGMGGRGGQGMGGNQGNGRGNRGNRGGNRGGGFGGWRTQDSVFGESVLLAQGPMGPGGMGGRGGRGRGGMMGGPGGMMGGGPGANMGNVQTKTINYVNVLTLNGNVYDIDMDKFYNDPSREFIPSPIISSPFFANGFMGYVTLDGHFRVHSVNATDEKVPYTFEFAPGSTDENKTVSANADILVKVFTFDKGSGIDFKSAKFSAKDVNGKEYNMYMIYDPSKQAFYGYLRNSQEGSIITPFADGTMNCEFSVKDYAGNLLTKKFSFKIDAAVAVKEDKVMNGSYFDVQTGKLLEVEASDFNEGIYTKADAEKTAENRNGSFDKGSRGGNSVASNNNVQGGVSGTKTAENGISTDKKKA